MRLRAAAGVIAALLIAGCSVPDIAPEMGVLSRSVGDVEASLAKSLGPRAAREHQARIREIARADGFFGLSPECAELMQAGPDVSVRDCAFETVVPEGKAVSTYEAEAVTRKMRGLKTYAGALAVIASSQSEDEILAAFDGVKAGAGKLAEVAEVPTLGNVASGLERQSGPIARAVRFSVGRLKVRALREITADYDADVQQLVREMRAVLLSIGHDPTYRTLHLRMTAANERLQDALLSGHADETARRALVAEDAHAAFVAHADGSDYAKLSAIARAHGALTKRLAGTAPRAEAEEFFAAIRALSDKL